MSKITRRQFLRSSIMKALGMSLVAPLALAAMKKPGAQVSRFWESRFIASDEIKKWDTQGKLPSKEIQDSILSGERIMVSMDVPCPTINLDEFRRRRFRIIGKGGRR